MSIKTTNFGQIIIEEAEQLLFKNIKEATNNNDGKDLYDLVAEFDKLQPIGNKKLQPKVQPPYCGITASVILDRAFARMNERNIFRTALAKDFIGLASKHKIRRDKTPTPGAVFLTRTSGEGSTSGYHAGIIWYVKGNVSATIEGNTPGGYHLIDGCLQKLPKNWDGVVQKMRPNKNFAEIIHIEEWFGKDLTASINPITWNMLSGLSENDFCLTETEIDESLDGETSDNIDNTNYLLYGGIAAAILGGVYMLMKK